MNHPPPHITISPETVDHKPTREPAVAKDQSSQQTKGLPSLSTTYHDHWMLSHHWIAKKENNIKNILMFNIR